MGCGRWAGVRRLRQGARHWALSLGAVGGDSPGSTLKGWRGGASSLPAVAALVTTQWAQGMTLLALVAVAAFRQLPQEEIDRRSVWTGCHGSVVGQALGMAGKGTFISGLAAAGLLEIRPARAPTKWAGRCVDGHQAGQILGQWRTLEPSTTWAVVRRNQALHEALIRTHNRPRSRHDGRYGPLTIQHMPS